MFPPVVAAVFTVAFAATGVYSLGHYVRLSARPAGSGAQARATELLHLLMSVAMVAMAWGWSGGPATGSGVVQLAVFGVFTLLFALFAVRAPDVAGAVGRAAHALMAAAMVWMVAAMPLLMGHTADAGGAGGAGGAGAGHAGHGAMGGMDMAGMDTGGAGAAGALAPVATPAWVLVVNGVVAGALLVSTVFWAARVVRVVREDRPGVEADVPPATGASDGAAVATRAAATTGATVTTARRHHGVLAATCHAVMSAGMAAMVLLMA